MTSLGHCPHPRTSGARKREPRDLTGHLPSCLGSEETANRELQPPDSGAHHPLSSTGLFTPFQRAHPQFPPPGKAGVLGYPTARHAPLQGPEPQPGRTTRFPQGKWLRGNKAESGTETSGWPLATVPMDQGMLKELRKQHLLVLGRHGRWVVGGQHLLPQRSSLVSKLKAKNRTVALPGQPREPHAHSSGYQTAVALGRSSERQVYITGLC